MRMDYGGVSLGWMQLITLRWPEDCHSFGSRILAVAILACGGSVRNQAYSRMPLNEMYNDTYG